MGRACSIIGEKRGAYGVLVGRRQGRRPLGRPRRRWEDEEEEEDDDDDDYDNNNNNNNNNNQ